MPLKFKHSQDYLNKLQIYINALMAVPLLLFIYFFLRIENNSYHPDLLNADSLFLMRAGILLAIIILIILGEVTFRKQMAGINLSLKLRDKLELFFNISITRSYYFEIATIISLLGLILSSEEVYVGYYAISLVAFSITYPTLQRISKQLRLNEEEREIIYSRDDIN